MPPYLFLLEVEAQKAKVEQFAGNRWVGVSELLEPNSKTTLRISRKTQESVFNLSWNELGHDF